MTFPLAQKVTAFQSITQAVTSLYERHPYPKYPLLARPRWIDGYLTTSLFSQRLTEDLTEKTRDLRGAAGSTNREMRVLIGGSGEILPYIIRQWEPWRHRLTCVDLSETSLRRARIRLALNKKPIQWVASDLNLYLESSLARSRTGTFGHIDAFGVIHHMPNPGQTLDLIAASLVPGGTARIMVYNSDARSWIRDFQKLFDALGISPTLSADIRFARQILTQATLWSQTLTSLVEQMGSHTLANEARFADTFLHPRECSLDCTWWLSRITQTGLKVSGLLDRYAELDDLANPLWIYPSAHALKERAQDGRFEGNLEIYVHRPGGIPRAMTHQKPPALLRLQFARALRYGPPRFWFSFRETKDLSLSVRWALWRAHLTSVLWPASQNPPKEAFLQKVPTLALKRLARVGAIFPGQIPSQDMRDTLLAPIAATMEAPSRPTTIVPIPQELLALMAQRLEQKGQYSDRRMAVVQQRLLRAARAKGRP